MSFYESMDQIDLLEERMETVSIAKRGVGIHVSWLENDRKPLSRASDFGLELRMASLP